MCAIERASKSITLCVRCTIFGYVRSKMLSTVVRRCLCKTVLCSMRRFHRWMREYVYIVCWRIFDMRLLIASLRCSIHSRDSQSKFTFRERWYFSPFVRCVLSFECFSAENSLTLAHYHSNEGLHQTKLSKSLQKCCFFLQIYIFFFCTKNYWLKWEGFFSGHKKTLFILILWYSV